MDTWREKGYVHLPGFMTEEAIERYDRLCRSIVAAWRRENESEAWIDATTNMSRLTELRYYARRDDLLTLLELIADPRILSVLRRVSGEGPLFHNTQFFFHQRQREWDGPWHRDTQFDAKDADDELRRMRQYTGVHFRIAFADDPWLQIVPGSHARPDRPKEAAIRFANDEAGRSSDAMPCQETLALARGDALLFHAWSIHRGRYRKTPRRSTLDVIYGWPGRCPFAAPDPSCFEDDRILDALSPHAREFFAAFVESLPGS